MPQSGNRVIEILTTTAILATHPDLRSSAFICGYWFSPCLRGEYSFNGFEICLTKERLESKTLAQLCQQNHLHREWPKDIQTCVKGRASPTHVDHSFPIQAD